MPFDAAWTLTIFKSGAVEGESVRQHKIETNQLMLSRQKKAPGKEFWIDSRWKMDWVGPTHFHSKPLFGR